MNDKNPTTLMYSRTMRPSKIEYANWIDMPKQSISLHDLLMVIIAILIYAGIIYVFYRY